MGMSSSQARLLTLTARLHSIEHRAQKLEADKLRLANDSDRVYEDYLRKLDSTKIQYSSLMANGSMTFVDATLARLENGAVPGYAGETSKNTFLLYDGANDKVLVTPEFAAEYGIVGGKMNDVGSLDDFLTNHGCQKYDVMQTVWETDYNDIQQVSPVANRVIKSPSQVTVQDADTYSLSGRLSTPVDHSAAATTSYSVSGTNPSVSATLGDSNYVDVVSGGSPASVFGVSTSSESSVQSTTYVLPSEYRALKSTTYRFKNNADLDKTFGELYGSLSYTTDGQTYYMDFNDSRVGHEITFEYSNSYSNGTYAPYPKYSWDFKYDENTTWRDILSQFVDENGTPTWYERDGYIYCPDWFIIRSHDCLPWNQLDGATIRETFTFEKEYESAQAITLNTKMADIAYSDVSTGNTDSWMREPKISIDGVEYGYKGSVSAMNVTVKDYLDSIIEQARANGVTLSYTTSADGRISLTAQGDHTFKYTNFNNGNLSKLSNTTNTNDVSVKTDAIAENIYLARSILNQTTNADYAANHDSSITAILNELKSAYGNFSTDENKRQLLLFAEELQAALQTGDQTKIQNALAKLGQTISSDKYKTSSTTKDNGSVETNKYVFTIDNTDVTVNPTTSSVADGTFEKGDLTVNGTNSEMEQYLAYKLYQSDSSKSFEQYLSQIQGQGYNAYQLAQLVENFSTYSSQLKAGTNLASQLTKYSASTHNLSQSSTGYNVTNTSTAATQEVTVANPDDILDALAYDIYQKVGAANPNSVKTQLRSAFNNAQLASLSSYYGTATWTTIVNNLAANMSASAVSAYTNRYNGYDITYKTSDEVSINTVQNSHQETIPGEVVIPTIQGIASNLVIAFRKAGYTVNEADVLAKLQAKYGADTNANNLTLANINDLIVDYILSNSGNISSVYNHLYNNSSLNISGPYNNNYQARRVDMGVASVQYGMKSHEEPTGEKRWVEDENYRKWYQKYFELKALSAFNFEIVREDLCVRNDFINNYITEGGAHLLAFALDEEGKFKLTETNVSVETSLLEVQNELGLKKAEAQYEADMKAIDKKDRYYDTQIAKCENERNAIKEELDSLKTVINDNVDRTFKLFS